MIRSLPWIPAVLTLTLLASCVSNFPTKQVSLDVTNEMVPVMLTKLDDAGKSRTVSLEAGYTKASSSSTQRTGNVSMTVLVNQSSNINQPLAQQIQSFLLREPRWTQVADLSITRFDSVLMLLGTSQTTTTTTILNLQISTEGAKQ